MAKKNSDPLFQLIKSLTKSEKRYFKLMESKSVESKFLRLFDLIDQQDDFDEKQILNDGQDFKPSQFSNLKAHLYAKILKSLRDYSLQGIVGIQIRELIDESQVLFNKSLYELSFKRLKKAEDLAQGADNLELQLEILKLKKQVLSHSKSADLNDIDAIVQNVQLVNRRINNIYLFSNLQSRLQSLYRRTGFIRNESEYLKIKEIFETNLPPVREKELSVMEKIHYYQLRIAYYFFVQQFESGYQYSLQWVELFRKKKSLIKPKLEFYITGLNYLMIAQFKLSLIKEFEETRREFRSLNKLPRSYYNENIRLRMNKYTFVHEFNSLIMTGEFSKGITLHKRLSSGLEQFASQLDPHSRIILFYKTACLYFGASDFRTSILWLNRILTIKETDLREDIHGFSRIMLLICHYELNDTELIQYYVRSTYRFLSQKQDLHQFQKLILRFLRGLNPNLNEDEVILRFKQLRELMYALKNDPYENRAFVYFDIISWLTSKIEGRKIEEVIQVRTKAVQPFI